MILRLPLYTRKMTTILLNRLRIRWIFLLIVTSLLICNNIKETFLTRHHNYHQMLRQKQVSFVVAVEAFTHYHNYYYSKRFSSIEESIRIRNYNHNERSTVSTLFKQQQSLFLFRKPLDMIDHTTISSNPIIKRKTIQYSIIKSSNYVRRIMKRSSINGSGPLWSTRNDEDNNDNNNDLYYNPKNTALLIVGQSSIICIGVLLGWLFNIPQYGFGTTALSISKILQYGILSTIPLGIFAIVLDRLETFIPAIKDVTKITQRTILSLMGNTYKPYTAIFISILLGIIAGIGEELLFRGVIQNILYNIIPSSSFLSTFQFVLPSIIPATTATITINGSMILSILLSSIIFGLLHCATYAYAILAMIASIYFGLLYIIFQKCLLIPIICHSLYDIIALYIAHYMVTKQLTLNEQMNIMKD